MPFVQKINDQVEIFNETGDSYLSFKHNSAVYSFFIIQGFCNWYLSIPEGKFCEKDGQHHALHEREYQQIIPMLIKILEQKRILWIGPKYRVKIDTRPSLTY